MEGQLVYVKGKIAYVKGKIIADAKGGGEARRRGWELAEGERCLEVCLLQWKGTCVAGREICRVEVPGLPG